jgi:hypothetical protein
MKQSTANGATARADDVRRDYAQAHSHGERETLNYEICGWCVHSRQWHLWGPRCHKANDCMCSHFVPTGRDIRQVETT